MEGCAGEESGGRAGSGGGSGNCLCGFLGDLRRLVLPTVLSFLPVHSISSSLSEERSSYLGLGLKSFHVK